MQCLTFLNDFIASNNKASTYYDVLFSTTNKYMNRSKNDQDMKNNYDISFDMFADLERTEIMKSYIEQHADRAFSMLGKEIERKMKYESFTENLYLHWSRILKDVINNDISTYCRKHYERRIPKISLINRVKDALGITENKYLNCL